MIYYPKGGTAPPHYHTGAEHFQFVIEGSGTAYVNGSSEVVSEGDIIYSFEDETHWFENYISDSFVFAEFFVPGNYKTIWENPEKVGCRLVKTFLAGLLLGTLPSTLQVKVKTFKNTLLDVF